MPLQQQTINNNNNNQNKKTYRVFFEETSLVGKNARQLTFSECKKRALKRLEFHNITIVNIEEEEYCYIPMGGELPALTQRVIAFGAAANMVHPSTGFNF
jgi:lycopene beta-cyclase